MAMSREWEPDFVISLLPCPVPNFLVNSHMLGNGIFCFERCLGQGLPFSYVHTENLGRVAFSSQNETSEMLLQYQ